MKVLYINNDGGGFADHIEIEAGTTVEKLFRERLPERSAGDYLIRVNRQPVVRDQVLQRAIASPLLRPRSRVRK